MEELATAPDWTQYLLGRAECRYYFAFEEF